MYKMPPSSAGHRVNSMSSLLTFIPASIISIAQSTKITESSRKFEKLQIPVMYKIDIFE